MPGLAAAHVGYTYQDLCAAYWSALALAAGDFTLNQECPQSSGDAFDDVVLGVGTARRRSQIKSRQNRPPLPMSFLMAGTGFPLTKAFGSFRASQPGGDEFHLIGTWSGVDAALQEHCVEYPVGSTLPGCRAWRLCPESIWPETGSPAILGLEAQGTRQQFIEFCSAFVIETDAPAASMDFEHPGPLETLLVETLSERVGIGYWPNHELSSKVAATSLLGNVLSARSKRREFRAADVIQWLRLRTDYGQVSEVFPVNAEQVVSRSDLVDGITDRLAESQRVAVVGEPGSGKSWLVGQLIQAAQAAGAIVATHYFYVSVDDEEREQRAQLDSMIAGLVVALRRAIEPDDKTPRYSATQSDLEALIARAGDRDVLLVLDGLDHVSRVLPTAVGLPGMSERVAEEIRNLALPPGARMLVASQPGAHLDALGDAFARVDVSVWNETELSALAERMGLWAIGGIDRFDHAELARLLADRSGGNPLYATYLIRELKNMQEAEPGASPDIHLDHIRNRPAAAEGLASYYDQLLNSANQATATPWLAEALSLLPFSVTIEELRSIRPAEAHRIDAGIRAIAPVLSQSYGVGGIRIYHESFERHVVARLHSAQGALAALSSELADWTDKLGFYDDPRAFRYLVRLRHVAQRADDLEPVDEWLVANAIRNGFGQRAIEDLLVEVADIAVDHLDLPRLIQLRELASACSSAFSDHLSDEVALAYARALVELKGVQALDRLLMYEGRPVFAPRPGLLLCQISDELGGSPDWESYLDGFEESEDNVSYGAESDTLINAARLRGLLRLRSFSDRGISSMAEFLATEGGISPEANTVAKMVLEVWGDEGLDALIEASKSLNRCGELLLVRAMAGHDFESTKDDAKQALNYPLGIASRRSAIRVLGGEAGPVIESEDPAVALGRAMAPEVEFSPKTLEEWLLSLDVVVSGAELDVARALLDLVPADSWYRCFLRFTIKHALVQLGESSAVEALAELSRDVDRFAGKPRATDLQGLSTIIQEEIQSCLELVPVEDWLAVLRTLSSVGSNTTAYLSGVVIGPFTLDALLQVAWDAGDDERRRLTTAFAIELLADGSTESDGYGTHALHELTVARMAAQTGRLEVAEHYWSHAAHLLSGYGWHKDTTIYETLESIPSVIEHDLSWGLERLERFQEPLRAVIVHTDGDGTNHAYESWLSMIVEHDLRAALEYEVERASYFGLAFGRDWETGETIDLCLKHGAMPEPTATYFRLLRPAVGCAEVEDHLPAGPTDLLERLACTAAKDDFPVAEVDGRPEPRTSDFVLPSLESLELPQLVDLVRQMRRSFSVSEAAKRELGVTCAAAVLDVQGDEAQHLIIDTIASLSETSSSNPLLESLAQALEDKGAAALAARAWTFAFTRAGDGWSRFGGIHQAENFVRAVALDEGIAMGALSGELRRTIRSDWGYGVTRGTVVALALSGLIAKSQQCWERAFEVLCVRLPLVARIDSPIVSYRSSVARDPRSTDTSGLALAMCSLADPLLDSRFTAELVVASALQEHPALFVEMLNEWPLHSLPVSALLRLLELSLQCELPPFSVTDSLRELLAGMAVSTHVGLRAAAARLLSPDERPFVRIGATITPVTRASADVHRKNRAAIQFRRIWPEFERLVADREELLLASPALRNQKRMFSDAIRGSRAIVPSLLWSPEDEYAELALHEVASGFKAHMLTKGEYLADADAVAADHLAGDLALRLRLLASRIPRPDDLPLPSELDTNCVEVPSGVATAAGEWMRIGYWEQEFEWDYSFDPTTRTSKVVIGGAVPASVEGSPIASSADPEIWWGERDAQHGPRPLAGLARSADRYGVAMLLCPCWELVELNELEPGPWWQGLTLRTAEGAPALLGRAWAREYASSTGQRIPRIAGLDLLLRRDVFEDFCQRTESHPVFRTAVIDGGPD